MDAVAAVQMGARHIELQQLPLPGQLGDDEALLAVEATGMCGTDWDQYRGLLAPLVPFPVVPGHETIGRIVSCGDTAAKRWGLTEGARVAVESTVACGLCPPCAAGRWLFCEQRLIYGLTSVTNEPGLSGGFAEYMLLRANSRVYALPDHLSTEDAVFFNPLGAGFDWGVRIAGTEPGDTVVIFGPGQRGLSSVIAARHAGARCVVVVGRRRSHWKLELARSLGATHTVDSETESVVGAVRAATEGRMADRVIDTTPGAMQPVLDACEIARPEGTVVLAAKKSSTVEASVLIDRLLAKGLTVRGAYSVSEWAKQEAIRFLSSGQHDLSRLHTHTMPLDQLDVALRTLGDEIDGERALHITITPGSR
ncbi:MAG TPA: alcohol dehydrogenase catalytic domain-containing protein [Acidimicrobiales bacterium]|jgi:threonine dehydrogenase-like Zn-dependent dehydrogenase|nr:alcohol dehydrogenase catalytic domain-containing protein [Acidimicrobiales bacterium]